MNDSIHLETNFEQYIAEKLHALSETDGWRISNNDKGFDPATALYMPDFIEYLEKTSPDKVEKMRKNFSASWQVNLRNALVHSLENIGTVLTLREGFPMAGYQTIDCSGGIPDDPRLERERELYDANILRVMRQVHYQTAGSKSLDLVFFINGIPVATAEVKTELTQTVQDAIVEYQTERLPVETGNRKNPLLLYKRGAVVHFAISEDEIWMCTNLEPKMPKFLPFNRGNNGHAGNPPMKKGDTDYPTGYFWNDICKKENWIRIFHNFVFEEVSRKEDVTGRLHDVRTQIFPRYHQWECVTKCINDVKEKGVGQKYLIEHSAGSGKTETITWIAHELIRLMQDDGTRLFSSVIVVTDRVGLDSNIKKTIKQLKKTVGLIEMIGGDGVKRTSGAKSKQLAEALHQQREIIVVTLQTFPFAMESIANDEQLVGKNFAVLIDEAHSSQNGKFSGKMKAALGFAAKQKKYNVKLSTATDEDAINAYFLHEQEGNLMPPNVSFFAFTATPKAETKTIFGRPGSEIDEKTGQPIPVSFDLYPMRQAIEEGYILDVLKGYMYYKTAYKLVEDVVPDKLVDERQALRTIARWENLHPTNVTSKAEFIIEHFVKNVSAMLDGQAKAMIVTSSRAAVVRYKYAIDAYLSEHPEYDRDKIEPNLQFKVPGEPLVAFSGKIKGDKCIMKEDEYLRDNPFAMIKRDFDYTETNMNNLGFQSIENAFDTPEYRIMIVADKFQTGFNQPKLCAMYIDKKMSNDIEIVQTYSRLNRTFPGKDHVYIIDFVNPPETVLHAFSKYDNGAEMEHAQSLEVIYDIKRDLDDAGIYTHDEFETYKRVRFESIKAMGEKRDDYRRKLYATVSAPAERWHDAMKAQQNAYDTWVSVKQTSSAKKDEKMMKMSDTRMEDISKEMGALTEFRRKLRKYCTAYGYISQIVDLADPDLEAFSGFASLLFHRLSDMPIEEIDTSSLVLSDYRILSAERPEVVMKDKSFLKPMRDGGSSRTAKKESMKEIVTRINEIWGEDVSTMEGARTINAMTDYVASDEVSRTQIRNSTNSREAVMADGRLENIIKLAALSLQKNDMGKLADRIITDDQAWKPLAELIYDLILKNTRLDIPELSEYLQDAQSNKG